MSKMARSRPSRRFRWQREQRTLEPARGHHPERASRYAYFGRRIRKRLPIELDRHWLLARDLQPLHSLVVHALRSLMPSEQRERRQPHDIPAATPLADADIEKSVINNRIRRD